MKKSKHSLYFIICAILVTLLALSFLFPLYWIITGSFKVKADIISKTPVWWPSTWVLDNYRSLLSKRSAPLFQIGSLVGPTIPAAFRLLSSLAWVYMRSVTALSLWPSFSETLAMSAPEVMATEAKLCRSLCGCRSSTPYRFPKLLR